MAEFISHEGKVVNVGEPVIFENNTDSDFSVSAAIVFRKSGLYDVSIVGRKIIVNKISRRKKGHWITDKYGNVLCSECNWCAPKIMTGCLIDRHLDYERSNFCWNCGADMRGEYSDE